MLIHTCVSLRVITSEVNLCSLTHSVMSWVNFGTLALLFGMMLIVGQVCED